MCIVTYANRKQRLAFRFMPFSHIMDAVLAIHGKKPKPIPSHMALGSFKPVLTLLIMPQALWLGIAVLALALFLFRPQQKYASFQPPAPPKHIRKKPVWMALAALLALWALSCHGTAVHLSRWLLPATQALQNTDIDNLRHQYQQDNRKAIIVLGAGAQAHAAEYNHASALTPYALERLIYGIYLSKETGWPLGYSGGMGWAQATSDAPEAIAAKRTAQSLGTPLAWLEPRSRDTQENALLSAQLLHPQQITHIILVTQAWHMPRAQRAFEHAGFTVTPAPVGFIKPYSNFWLEWLPSVSGISTSTIVLKEWIGLRIQSFIQ